MATRTVVCMGLGISTLALAHCCQLHTQFLTHSQHTEGHLLGTRQAGGGFYPHCELHLQKEGMRSAEISTAPQSYIYPQHRIYPLHRNPYLLYTMLTRPVLLLWFMPPLKPTLVIHLSTHQLIDMHPRAFATLRASVCFRGPTMRVINNGNARRKV